MGCAKTGSRSDLVHSCNLLATALEQLINLGCSLESSATLGKVPGLVSGHSDSGGLFGTKDSTVKAGFKNPHSEDLLNLPPLRNSHYVFPFQAFITLHLHSGNNFYLWFHSRLSLINLLHCHISYLASNLPKVPLPAGQCSYSVASHTMVLYLDFGYEIISSHFWFLTKQATCSSHYAISSLYTWAFVDPTLCKTLFCWQCLPVFQNKECSFPSVFVSRLDGPFLCSHSPFVYLLHSMYDITLK